MFRLDSASTPFHLTVAFSLAFSVFAIMSWLFNLLKTPATLPASKLTVPAQDLPPAPKPTSSSKAIPTPTPSEVAAGTQETPEMAFRSLRRSLRNLLEPRGLDIPDRKFLPAHQVRALVTTATLRSVLPNATQEVIDFVHDRAPKLFLTLILEPDADDGLESLMKACWEHRFTDELLPIDDTKLKCTGREHAKCGEAHAEALNVFHKEVWKDIHQFGFNQGSFLSPVFTRDKFVYKLGAQCVLPFTHISKATAGGHFSTVFEAWVHPDHHDVRPSQPDPKGLRVALKELRDLPNEPKYKVEDAWKNEAAALEKISGLRHKHLIQPLAAISRGSNFYIMFEWADGGSLRTLWQSQGHEPKDLDADRVMCFLEEVSGLAGALSALHNTNRNTKTAKAVDLAKFSNTNSKIVKAVPFAATPNTSSKNPRAVQKTVTFAESPLISPTTNTPGIHLQEASDGEGSRLSDDGSRSYYSDDSDMSQPEAGEDHWRHGDLKPDNILRVLSSDTEAASQWLGTLKIADLGLAKQHFLATERRNDQTNMEYTTSQYEAPEANRFMGIFRNPRSRRFDIWSMGCVLLEFVIVLLYGNKGLKAFSAESKNLTQGTETLYFTVDRKSGKARVSMVASHWIKHILNDPECKRSQSALGDVVRLVRDRLLVVELPREGMSLSEVEDCRADAAELQERLEAIWKKARDDEENKGDYLFATKNRSDVPIPPPLGRATPSSTAATSTQKHLGDDFTQQQRGPLFDTTWNFLVDNSFPSTILQAQAFKEALLYFARTPKEQMLCKNCAQLDVFAPGVSIESIRTIKTTSEMCRLHELMYDACRGSVEGDNAIVEISREDSNLFLKDRPSPILQICRSGGEVNFENNGPNNKIQIGFPSLLHNNSPGFFQLIFQWLLDCDDTHQSTCHSHKSSSTNATILPTRLIDVGHGNDDSGKVFLRVSRNITKNKAGRPQDLKYIALSHPWGNAAEHDHFCTTQQNFIERLRSGIPISDLPKTFKDAVLVTRALRIRYIWIDSLCILQGIDGDFHQEAKLMETVFSMAYCVIAASQAQGTSSGFLSEKPRTRKFVKLNQHLPSGDNLYVCEAIDDFQSHVIDGPLNKRGWVLQERALARRTIYFTETQTYFECGAGVRCETLTKMTNDQAAFLGDPNFPNLAMKSTKGARIRIYESLYKTYSRLQFSNPHDRPIAIAGLEQRLVTAFDTHGGYGVFDGEFFGRSLLWKRDSEQGMKRIDFTPAQMLPLSSTESYTVPTWSWMAYEGAITFLDLPFRGVEWRYRGERRIKSPWETETIASSPPRTSSNAAWHTGSSGEKTHLGAWASDFSVPLEIAKTKITFDAGNDPAVNLREGRNIKCVIVGRQKSKAAEQVGVDTSNQDHYVLVVIASPRERRQDRYERIGVAVLPGSWIAQEQQKEVCIY